MSEAKHTPGPWELDVTSHHGVDYGFSGVRTVSDEGYEFPQRSYTRTICQTPHGFRTDDAEPKANMRLIAAAPDLLEVARMAEAVALMELGRAAADFSPQQLLDAAQAAIAKAEGRQ